MKKITSIFLSCLLILSMIANVSATTLNETDDAGETKIEYTVGETYTVVIPAEVVVSKDTETPAEYDVVVKDLLIPYESSLVVSVEYEGKLKLFEHAATTLEYQMIKSSDSSVIANGGEVISVPAGTVDEQVEKISAKLIETPIIAGVYEDTATFKINVDSGKSQYGEAIQMWNVSATAADDVWMTYYQPKAATFNARATTTNVYENGTVYITGTGNMEDYIYYYFIDEEALLADYEAYVEADCGYNIRLEKDSDYSFKNFMSYRSGVTMYIDDEAAGDKNGTIQPRNYDYDEEITYRLSDFFIFMPTRVVIDEGVTNTSEFAFMGTQIKSLELPATIKSIGEWAFVLCSELSDVKLNEGLESIENGAFAACTNLTSITIPDSVKNIGFASEDDNIGAFESCINLTDVRIGSGVTSIEYHAFQGCEKLMSISIPDNVTNIGDAAFENLPNGSTIYCETQAVADLLIAGSNYTAAKTTVVVDASKFAASMAGTWNQHSPATEVVCTDGTVAI